MTFALEYTARALRDLKALDRQDARRVTVGLKGLEAQEMPWLHVKKLRTSPSHEPVYSFRVGSHRVLIEFDFEHRRIVVDEVSPRRTSYRDLWEPVVHDHPRRNSIDRQPAQVHGAMRGRVQCDHVLGVVGHDRDPVAGHLVTPRRFVPGPPRAPARRRTPAIPSCRATRAGQWA
jgi:mRNA-degrading endonuclease RelE of RelBE toxin-antitoxin system